MSVISRIESLPGRIVRGIFRTSDALEINKILGAILAAAMLAMVTGIVADILVPAPGETEHGPTAVAEGAATAKVPAAGQPGAPAGVEPVLALLASANVDAGKEVAKKCAACHTFEKGAPAKVGPNLYGIVGAKRAHQEGFAYSEAVKSLGGQWTYAEINKFIANPRADVPGTKMGFAGLKNVKDRADVIAFLRTLSDSPAPPPTEAEIAAEAAQAKGSQAAPGAVASAAPAATTTQGATAAAPAAGQQAATGTAAPAAGQQAATGTAAPAAGTSQQGGGAAAQAPAPTGGDVVAMIAKAKPEQGKDVARKCLTCHTFEKGQSAKVGPNLYNVVGSKMASKEFPYSDALKGKGGTWTYQNLDTFLTSPRQFVPGTKMTFAGLKQSEERAAVIAYLRTLNDNPPPLQ